jgi:hypothetical protein
MHLEYSVLFILGISVILTVIHHHLLIIDVKIMNIYQRIIEIFFCVDHFHYDK